MLLVFDEVVSAGKQGVVRKNENGELVKYHKRRHPFQREMWALQCLKDVACVPNLIRYDLEEWSITMKDAGVNLKRLERNLTAEETKAMIEGIAEINAAGYEHGDLCATNIVVDKEGKVSFIDFGNAERRESNKRKRVIEIEYQLFNTCQDVWTKMDRPTRKKMDSIYAKAYERFCTLY